MILVEVVKLVVHVDRLLHPFCHLQKKKERHQTTASERWPPIRYSCKYAMPSTKHLWSTSQESQKVINKNPSAILSSQQLQNSRTTEFIPQNYNTCMSNTRLQLTIIIIDMPSKKTKNKKLTFNVLLHRLSSLLCIYPTLLFLKFWGTQSFSYLSTISTTYIEKKDN